MNIYSQISNNRIKTYSLFVFFILFTSFLVYLLGTSLGYSGGGLLAFALILSFFTNFISYFFSDKIILAIHQAKEADRQTNFNLYTVTENLAIASGIPKPRVYVIEDLSPNAFATGRDPKHAIVVVTTGLLLMMDRRELEGVIAHELSHIKNYDILLMTVASVMVGLIVYLTDFFMRSLWFRGGDDNDNKNSSAIILALSIILAILAPIIATLFQLAISRKREFLADASSAYLTRYPEGLARALEKLAGTGEKLKTASNATADLFIVSPLKADITKKNGWFTNLFCTHPLIAERIAKLREM